MKNVLFIASLVTKKEKYDGERIKSTLMFSSLKDNYNVTFIDLSTNKLFKTIKIFITGLFRKKKYEKVVVSKDPHGANIIFKILRFVKFPLNKILYFEIGPFLYDRILNGSIKKKTFKNIKIIVETQSMKGELESIGVDVFGIFPNFKNIYNVPIIEHIYPKKVLDLVFFSRIDEMKGVYDLMECVSEINKKEPMFHLDIFGKYSINFDEERFRTILESNEQINYVGKISLDSLDGYIPLSKYDLHVFPTKYSEGFPGTLIDFFIAGVPTLSSTFARAKDILSDKDSFFFELGNKDDLKNKLFYIYNNQNMLIEKRVETQKKKDDYSIEKFKEYCKTII